ncbi:putative reverse transcriptase domain-containing protein, partial [Tanacetum coccineum]
QQGLVKEIKGSGKTTKETPTIIILTTTATETSTPTINNKTEGKKMLRLMLQPQLRVGATLGIYHGAIGARHIISKVRVLLSVVNVIGLVIRKRIVKPGCQQLVAILQIVTCYGCEEKGHYRNKFPKGRNQSNEGARARAYVMGTENPQQNPNVVTGTFLLNDHYASILFDSGAEKSFVSTAFTPFIDIAPAALDTSYEVELADGKVVSTNTVLRGCTLALFNHVFKI